MKNVFVNSIAFPEREKNITYSILFNGLFHYLIGVKPLFKNQWINLLANPAYRPLSPKRLIRSLPPSTLHRSCACIITCIITSSDAAR